MMITVTSLKISRLRSNRQRQIGQATIEMVVIALVLASLLVIIPILGKYMDIAQTTIQASRYVAFEGMVHHASATGGWKTDAQLTQEVQRRFFSRGELTPKSGETAHTQRNEQNLMWTDHRGDTLFASLNDVSISTQKKSLATLFTGIGRALDMTGDLNLPDQTLYTGNVHVNLAAIDRLVPFDQPMLNISRSTTVLVDSWSANGPSHVESRIQDAVNIFPYKRILSPNASILEPFIGLIEFQSQPPDVGRVDPDMVPRDRVLDAYR